MAAREPERLLTTGATNIIQAGLSRGTRQAGQARSRGPRRPSRAGQAETAQSRADPMEGQWAEDARTKRLRTRGRLETDVSAATRVADRRVRDPAAPLGRNDRPVRGPRTGRTRPRAGPRFKHHRDGADGPATWTMATHWTAIGPDSDDRESRLVTRMTG